MIILVTPNTSASSESTSQTSDKEATSAYSLVPVIGVALFGLLLSILALKALTADFLGSGTRLVDMCKQDPKHNPAACGPILEARAPLKRKTSRETGVQEKSVPFQLFERQ
jgi:hypothetical protein